MDSLPAEPQEKPNGKIGHALKKQLSRKQQTVKVVKKKKAMHWDIKGRKSHEGRAAWDDSHAVKYKGWIEKYRSKDSNGMEQHQ